MNRILLIAQREFVTTVSNKGFLLGLFIMPALVAAFLVLGPRILSARSPAVRGTVAVIDPTGRVLPELRTSLAPAAIEKRRAENGRRVASALGSEAGDAIQQIAGSVPVLTLTERPASADLAKEKVWLSGDQTADRPLALVVIHQDTVQLATKGGEFGTFDLYVSRNLDDTTESTLWDGLRDAIVKARVTAASLDPAGIETMTRVVRPSSTLVSASGERQMQRAFTRFLPFLFGILLFVGVVMGGQSLMTATVEEKSSRVVEVLLSAVSPFELMAGKLIGQLGVGLLAMAIYIGLGMLALYSFAMFGLLDPILLVYFFVFFLITYFVFGALMMAIGAAVNQVAEAQSLMGPVMLLLVAPYVFTPMIGRAPNSTFSVALSFIPPLNSFAIMARLASDTPPPIWQVVLAALVGVGAACAAVWFAAKVFKIGLLMHGRPPNFATLVKWARAA